ncbi:signal transduction protein Syg1, putative [Metarhizium acridum CQMa 102]|uniref:Signal transduction protein Syg1, putative n=1 Tax=Metarhizium acridum (strain CQMa 102) TaxID=655827 RepID=E9E5D6_METAQ|nr:signal transduction protein Syg1, putative [Metarhizium acridum CQMa 102]EFY88819.1 signal transduction protein Syg1, putative [Metarhizium acridum CQMa 102]
MKFAKELERDAVPEWRIKYLNYKAGKKYVKAVSRALNRTPRASANRTQSLFRSSNHGRTSILPTSTSGPAPRASNRSNGSATPGSNPIPIAAQADEDEALRGDGNDLHYGSFVPTPPNHSPLRQSEDKVSHDFALPAPAISASDASGLLRPTTTMKSRSTVPTQRRASTADSVTPRNDTVEQSPAARRRSITGGALAESPSQLRRILSNAYGPMKRDMPWMDGGINEFDLVREREREFYAFLDSELEKVESFYKLKEDQAGQRLALLREQLHEMRNRRIREIASNHDNDPDNGHYTDAENSKDNLNGWVQPLKAKIFPPGPNTKALRNMPNTPYLPASASAGDATRDYSRRRQKEDVSYRTAKRKLKLALQEFYRGLELLKSYALLNRTAFHKLNKKFDKAVNARPALRYMNEKVNTAWFVNSDTLDGHIKAVEDLYARYFERGNHKLAAGKLRSLSKRSRSESGSSFINGFLIGCGLIFTVEGLVSGSQLLFDSDADLRIQTSYLLQLYAGYFLMLFMFSFFCINCFIWTKNKINYRFIFEFDQRSVLDWRRLAEFPSFFLLLFGIFMWMNFSRYGPDWLYTYYPVFLISITAAIILFPGPTLSHKSRSWFVYAHNIELFFCLYANKWDNPPQCNSNHSRLLGFFMALPPIWRLFQCIRRYKDTCNVFPHLVNGGKYIMTIISTVMLSLYRINGTRSNLALYVAFSTINGIYVSIWDLFMDFSLLQTDARHFALRDILAFKRRWPYYFIMVVDPLLRFAWIFYAIFTHDLQHSTLVAFVVSFVEIVRRGLWALFRVENEHCANVSQYKASRDVPLPYRIEPLMDRASEETSPVLTSDEPRHELAQSTGGSTAVASTLGALRRRADTISARSFSKILAEAHKQDFVKRRKPGEAAEGEAVEQSDDEDDEEDEAEAASLLEAGEARG